MYFLQGKVGSGAPEDKENFTKFLNELRQKFDDDYKKGLFAEKPTLSVAVSGNLTIVDAGTFNVLYYGCL
jgi:GH18 family chitinase